MHQRFKQMCRVSKGPLTRHRRLLDQGHGQAPAPHPPAKQECCQQPALHLHGPTVTQVSRHRSLHHHSPHYHLQATNRLQEDENTSVSWDLVDTDTDAEVANINLAPTHQTVTNQNCVDSTNKMQNNAVGLNHELNTLYNQDFFVADTTGRRLSRSWTSPIIHLYCPMEMLHFS